MGLPVSISLHRLLSYQFLLAAFIPFVLMAIVILIWMRPELEANVEKSQERWAKALTGEVEQTLHGAAITLTEIARTLVTETPPDRRAIESHLDLHLILDTPFDTIYLADQQGKLKAVGLTPEFRSRRPLYQAVDVSRQQLFMDSRNTQQPVWSDSYLSVIARSNTVALALPAGDSVLIGEFAVDELAEIVSTAGVPEGGVLMILDRNGRVIVDYPARYGAQRHNLANLTLVRDSLDTRSAHSGRIMLGSDSYIATITPVDPIGWHVLVGDLVSNANQPVTSFIRVLVVATALGVVVGLLIAGVLARTLSNRAADVEEYAIQVAQGHYASLPHVTRISEFLSINQALEKLAAEVMDRERQLRDANAGLEENVRRRTQELEKANEDLSVANRDLESFAYTASHDLRAPLRSVNGYAALLMEEHGEDFSKEARELFQRIQKSATRMDSIIADILRLSHAIRSGISLERLDLSKIVRGIAEQFMHNSPQRQVEWDIQKDLIVQADRGLMMIAMDNLVSNAFKYTAKISPAVISFSATELGEGQWEYCIRDNGAGFDPAHADMLFKPFKRLHAMHEFEGNGIGLATVKRIIERHGGTIRAEAVLGQGAAFYFTLKPDR